jgi:hypothetical protein
MNKYECIMIMLQAVFAGAGHQPTHNLKTILISFAIAWLQIISWRSMFGLLSGTWRLHPIAEGSDLPSEYYCASCASPSTHTCK